MIGLLFQQLLSFLILQIEKVPIFKRHFGVKLNDRLAKRQEKYFDTPHPVNNFCNFINWSS